MKRPLMLAVAAAFALPLLAEDAAQKPAPAQPQAPAATQQQDSPLVAAARRANRLGKKPANVITNANLTKASGARVTTTKSQAPLRVPAAKPPRPTPEMVHAAKLEQQRKDAAAAEEKRKQALADYEQRLAAAAARAEEGMHDELEDPDGGEGERDLQKVQSEKPPQV
jgi:hypothetical protein